MKSTKVPLELLNLHDDGFHLLVEVVVFGQPFKAVLDTGASKTVFDKTSIEMHITDGELLISDKLSTVLGLTIWKAILLSCLQLKSDLLNLKTLKQQYLTSLP